MTNIIQFPVERIIRERTAEAELAYVANTKYHFVEKQVDRYGSKIIDSLHKQGFDVDSPEFLEDYVLLMEVFKSCLLRNLGLEHPLQKIQHILQEMILEDS